MSDEDVRRAGAPTSARPRGGRRARGAVAILAVAAIVLVAAAGGLGSAWWLTRPCPAPEALLPPDLPGESVQVSWSGGTLATWVVPAAWDDAGSPRAGILLLLHGWRGGRSAMLGRMRLLHAAGYALVVPDLPAHGSSPGDAVTFGAHEGAAVDALLAFTRERFPDGPLGVVAVSLGGASLLMARRDVPLRAVVLESVFPTLDVAVSARMRRFLGPLGPPLTPLLVAGAHLLHGVSPEDVRPVDRIASLGCPLLWMHGTEDASTLITDARALYAAAREPKEAWEVPHVGHADLCASAPTPYRERLLGFLGRTMAGD